MRSTLLIAVNVLTVNLLLCSSSTARADGGLEKCDLKRPLTAAEKSDLKKVVARFQALLPAPPRGFKLRGEGIRPEAMPAQTAKALGCPIRFESDFAYYSFGAAAAAGGKVDAQKVMKLTEAIAAAAQRGDTAAVARLQQELQSHQRVVTKDVATSINLTVNGVRDGSAADAQALTLPGATFAYVRSDAAATFRVILYVGRFRKGGNHIEGAPRDIANAAPQFMEIIISGSAAREFAKTLNLKGINALLK